MKLVWFIFVSIYAAGIVVTGTLVAYACLMDHSLENMRWWYALVLEGGFLASPVVLIVSWIIAIVWSLFSKTSAEEFSVPKQSKRIFLIVGILFFLVAPVFLLRDSMIGGAARKGSIGGVRFWLVLGADDREALSWGIIYGQQDVVASLLKQRPHLLENNSHWGTNYILSSVPNGHEDLADVLKKYGAKETGVRDRQDAIGCKRTPEQHRYANFTNK
jgi:hypothetical protein